MLQLIRNDLNINFVRMRWIGFVLSAALVLLGLIAFVQIIRGQARMGVDFGGGTALEVEFQKPVTADALRQNLKSPKFEDVSLQNINEPGRVKYMIRVFAPEVQTGQVSNQVEEVLKQNLPENPATILSSEEVGPSVSAHLRQQAMQAIFWAMVGILIYIWWRFDFRFAVAATVATVHDVLAVLGVMFVMNFEINLILYGRQENALFDECTRFLAVRIKARAHLVRAIHRNPLHQPFRIPIGRPCAHVLV